MTRDIAGSELKEVVNKLYVHFRTSSVALLFFFFFLAEYQIASVKKSKKPVVEFIHYKTSWFEKWKWSRNRNSMVGSSPLFSSTLSWSLFLVARLMEMHGESYSSVTVDEKGQRVERADGYEPPVQSTV